MSHYHNTHSSKSHGNDSYGMNKANHKRILCQNVLISKKCNYGDKCIYAHSLSEQKIDPMRKQAYNLFDQEDLSTIDLSNDKKLYDALVQISKLCVHCKNMECQGGYNCREGSYSVDFVVCYDDITFGICKKLDCKKTHFSQRGLQPFRKPKKMFFNKKVFNDDSKSDYELSYNDSFPKTLFDDNKDINLKSIWGPSLELNKENKVNDLLTYQETCKYDNDTCEKVIDTNINKIINRQTQYEFSDSSDDFNIYVGIEPTSDSDNESIFY